jgi:hypothetical protein
MSCQSKGRACEGIRTRTFEKVDLFSFRPLALAPGASATGIPEAGSRQVGPPREELLALAEIGLSLREMHAAPA